ncbi:MAG: GYD domain-containing protein [Thermoanaerobaculia bacterium]|nr:GYD domain-containing protein [Thermoanaerobaculia bacterium]
MLTFVLVIDFTGQGRKDLNQSLARAEDFQRLAESRGAQVLGQYWTTGPHDGLVLISAPDGEVAAGLAFALGAGGAVRARVSRAFSREEMAAIVDDLG